MLRLLARTIVPSKGFIYYPPNWRVRFLDQVSYVKSMHAALSTSAQVSYVKSMHAALSTSACTALGALQQIVLYAASDGMTPWQ